MDNNETLMARCLRLEAELAEERQQKHDALHREYERREELAKQLAASQLHIERLTAALNHLWHNVKATGKRLDLGIAPDVVKAALSQTPSLDALNEERARVLEEAKRRWYYGEFPGRCAEDALQLMADAYRAKKEG